MSSSGGGGGSPYFGDEVPDCSKLRIRTNLGSPDPKVVATLKKGDVLAVVYEPPRGPLYVETSKGKRAGSILTGDQVKLISCIADGHTYAAEVLSVSGGKCEVEISSND